MRGALSGDTVNFDFGEVFAMSILDTVAFPSLFLEDDTLIASLITEHGGTDLGGVEHRLSEANLPFAVDEVDLVEGDAVAFRGI